MKKIIFVALLVLVLAALAAAPVLAKPGQVNIKGEVTAVGAGTLTIFGQHRDRVVSNRRYLPFDNGRLGENRLDSQ